MNKMRTRMWMGILIAFCLVFGAALSDAAVRQGAVNRVVVVVDCSGSFKARRMEAVQATTRLLESMAETKLHRWETGNSEVVLIALDAMPEVIWKGDLKKLKKTDRKEWTDRFNARKDLTGCTDVKAALELAAAELQGDPSLVHKYLFVFSDLVHEPPTTSVSRCQKALYGPSPDLPWGAFEDVSVSVFWVPANIKLTWDRAVKEQGLQAFKLFSTSQSDAEKISPPPKPVRVVTEEEQAESRAALINLGTGALTWAGYLVAGFVALTILMAAGARFRRRLAPARPSKTQAPPPRDRPTTRCAPAIGPEASRTTIRAAETAHSLKSSLWAKSFRSAILIFALVEAASEPRNVLATCHSHRTLIPAQLHNENCCISLLQVESGACVCYVKPAMAGVYTEIAPAFPEPGVSLEAVVSLMKQEGFHSNGVATCSTHRLLAPRSCLSSTLSWG